MSDRCLIGSTESPLGETPRNVPGCLWQRVSPWRPAHALRSSDDIPPSRGVEIFCLVELLHRRGEVLTHLSVWHNYKLGIISLNFQRCPTNTISATREHSGGAQNPRKSAQEDPCVQKVHRASSVRCLASQVEKKADHSSVLWALYITI